MTYVVIELPYVLSVQEYKSSLRLEPEAQYIFHSVFNQLCNLFNVTIGGEHVFVVISYLNHHGSVKDFLQITSGLQGHGMTQIKRGGLRAFAYQEIKGFFLFN